MPKHIQGRTPLKPAKSVRPLRVSIWRTAGAIQRVSGRKTGSHFSWKRSASRRLPDTPVSRCAPLLVVPASAARLARCETELAVNSLKGL